MTPEQMEKLFQEFFAGRCLYDAQIRRKRSRARHQPPVLPDDGWGYRRRKRGGRGSTFSIRLPVTIVKQEIVTAPAASTGAHSVVVQGDAPLILVVDDDVTATRNSPGVIWNARVSLSWQRTAGKKAFDWRGNFTRLR